MKKEIIYYESWESLEKKKKKEAALTLYGDAIHSPGDGGFGCAAGQAGQPAALPWS